MNDFNPVLVCVDDEADILEHLKGILDHEEFGVETFTDAGSAMAFIESRRSDVFGIFSDYKMPDVDGLQFKKLLNEKGCNSI